MLLSFSDDSASSLSVTFPWSALGAALLSFRSNSCTRRACSAEFPDNRDCQNGLHQVLSRMLHLHVHADSPLCPPRAFPLLNSISQILQYHKETLSEAGAESRRSAHSSPFRDAAGVIESGASSLIHQDNAKRCIFLSNHLHSKQHRTKAACAVSTVSSCESFSSALEKRWTHLLEASRMRTVP